MTYDMEVRWAEGHFEAFCADCEEWRPLDPEHWRTSSLGRCKACWRASERRWEARRDRRKPPKPAFNPGLLRDRHYSWRFDTD